VDYICGLYLRFEFLMSIGRQWGLENFVRR
jgi:hypothetical protein